MEPAGFVPVVCRRCRARLDCEVTLVDGQVVERRWIHGGVTLVDHTAEPVPGVVVSPVTVCDFCGCDEPRWSLPAGEHALVLSEPADGMPGYVTSWPWLACDTCRVFIDNDRWLELLGRAVARIALANPGLRIYPADVAKVHGTFRDARSGPAVPL